MAALVVACILSCRVLDRREVGEAERYLVGETVPFISAAVLGAAFDFRGEVRDEKSPLETAEGSVLVRTEDRPGTVLIGEDVTGAVEVTTFL